MKRIKAFPAKDLHMQSPELRKSITNSREKVGGLKDEAEQMGRCPVSKG